MRTPDPDIQELLMLKVTPAGEPEPDGRRPFLVVLVAIGVVGVAWLVLRAIRDGRR